MFGTVACPGSMKVHGYGPRSQQASLGIGDYAAFQAASSGTNQAMVALGDATKAVGAITGNMAHMERLTWDSFIREMGKQGYPSDQIIALRDMAWPFLPSSVRDRLSKRESPAAPAAPATPPKSMPVTPSPNFPGASSKTPWTTYATYGGIGVAALIAAILAKRFLGLGARRATA